MNKIFRIVWNEAAQAWVAVSELTKKHKKRASATVVAVALVAGVLSPFAEASKTASGGGVDSENPVGGYTPPRPTDIEGPDGNSLNGLGFGLVVVDKEGHRKEILPGKKIEDTTDDDEKISTVITVEPNNDSASEPPKKETSYLYLVEGEGVTIDQNGRSAKFSVNTGDGLKIDNNNKVAADTVELTVNDGKVTAPDEADKKKLVNAGDLSSTLNNLGWKVSANGSGSTTSIVKSGEEVEFKGEGGVTVTATTDANGKHVVTIKTEQPQGGAAGGGTPVTAGNGISVSTDNKVSVNAKADGGLTVGADGVSVNAKNNGGIKVDGTGVSVDVDGKTIEVGADGKVTAKVASAKGLEKTDDGLAIKSKTNGGLTVDTDGVSVKTDGTTISVDAATGNVKAVTGGFTTNTTTGATEANKNDANKLATVGNVASAINAAKVKVEAGSGAEVAHDAKTNTYTVSAKVEGNKGLENKTEGLSVKAGEGVTVDDKGVSVKSKTNGGLTVDTDGVSVHANTNGGIKVDANGVSVNAKANGGIKVDGEGVSVDADGKTIEVGADGKVTAKVASAKGLEKTDDGLAIKSKTNGGLTVDTDGVSVKTDGATITVDTATGDTVANANDGDKLTTVTNVASAINAAKVKVVAGNGAEVARDAKTNTYTVSAKIDENKGLENKTEGLSVKAGEGVTVDDKGVSVKSKTNGGLTVDTDGVSVHANTNGGIKVDANGVSVNAKANGGIKVDGEGVSVDADGKTIEVGADGKVTAKVASAKGLEKTDDGLAIKSKANGGLTVDADGVSVNAKANGGISLDGGVSVDTDNTTINVTNGKVSAVTGTITAGDNASVADDDKGKLAKAGEVAAAINAAKTKVVAGSGIKVTSSGNEYTVSADLPFTKNADKSISLNEEGVIRNVANGRVAKDSKDAVNGSQLHAVEGRLSGNMDKLNHRIDKVGKRADAGTASAIATANLLQSYRPGLSAATAAVGQYRGQSAVAVGYSHLSDNGKYGVKFSLGANTQGNVGAGAGVAYFW